MAEDNKAALFSHARTEWETPHDLFVDAHATHGFTLDVCATTENAKCARYYTKEKDGLAQVWDGVVWCNPPYGRGVGAWLRKGAEELASGRCVVAVYLLPARTDTMWFHECLWDRTAHHPRTGIEIHFLRGRLTFHQAPSSAPFPSMLVVMRAT
jgi:phage N-6-adenine-methyltransferase